MAADANRHAANLANEIGLQEDHFENLGETRVFVRVVQVDLLG